MSTVNQTSETGNEHGTEYNLRQDIEELRSLARARNDKPDSWGQCTDPESTKQDVHLRGLKGEKAVARRLDTEIDTEIISDGGDDGVDLRFDRGDVTITVQVKTAAERYAGCSNLLVPAEHVDDTDKAEPDMYVLCEETGEHSVRIVGAYTQEDIEYRGEWPRDRENYVGDREAAKTIDRVVAEVLLENQ